MLPEILSVLNSNPMWQLMKRYQAVEKSSTWNKNNAMNFYGIILVYLVSIFFSFNLVVRLVATIIKQYFNLNHRIPALVRNELGSTPNWGYHWTQYVLGRNLSMGNTWQMLFLHCVSQIRSQKQCQDVSAAPSLSVCPWLSMFVCTWPKYKRIMRQQAC